MRGKVRLGAKAVGSTGITPAYAGKRLRSVKSCIRTGDHPRVCGEKKSGSAATACSSGSPPRMRGKVDEVLPADTFKRITPRVCGEKFMVCCPLPLLIGSPPHVRGKESHARRKRQAHGITPACAGKRLKRSRSTVPPVAIVPLFPSVCNKPVASDGSPAGRDAPLFLPAENAVPASPAYNLRSL